MKRDDMPSLLLLPFPPDPVDRHVLSASYKPPLTATLSQLKMSDKASRLVVAVPCPILQGPYVRCKTFAWAETQSLVAGVYAIISVICAQLSIATDVNAGPESVDATVVLIDHDRNKRFPPDFRPAIEPNNTVIVDLATFATAYHPWDRIFHVRSELGLRVFNSYLKLAEGRQTLLHEQLVPVEGGLSLNVSKPDDDVPPPQTDCYPVVCLGGTFDHLHPGHKLLLTAGALLLKVPEKGSPTACKFIIGVTGDEMLKNKKYAEFVEPWATRARNVLLFLSTLLRLSPRGWRDGADLDITETDGSLSASFRDGLVTVQCVVIQDAFGPTITLEQIDALVVSGETRSGGKAVNDKRAEKGWKALEVFEVDVLDAEEISDGATRTENFASKISSTAIRQRRAQAKRS
ncbi:Nucleotidylyl transferase [Coniochaeta hoffmannii]|uniref:Nucleotidylyl transferase n=1 Tax=Coniochaeta hoffmannii TaxID=91930 RepID=A0AA38RZM5_9PEZI|nr:Nucleotidylyl transferase [Coniochaeta hoffmannii]